MKVLVACEFSGVVRDAFLKRGHDAWSCDLLPCESDIAGRHYQGDVLSTVDLSKFDLMIAHPPCTHLAVSGARWFKNKVEEQKEALEFVQKLMDAPIPKICIENPVSIISTKIRKPDQIIQPWQFGHSESKATCLWLKGLPLLETTKVLSPSYHCKCGNRFEASLGKYGCSACCGDGGPARLLWNNQTPTGQNNVPPGPDQWKKRSITYQGIAEAMATQWGGLT